MKSQELITLLINDGLRLRKIKGSHHVYVHDAQSGHITIPHPKKDLGLGLVHKIMKQANLK